MHGEVKVKHNEDTLRHRLTAKVQLANRLLLEDIHRESQPTTPFKGGDLREQVSKTVDGLEGTIIWKVPYAQYQERGMRADGTHVVRKYTTPGTRKGFAKRAVRKALSAKNLAKYITFGKTYRR